MLGHWVAGMAVLLYLVYSPALLMAGEWRFRPEWLPSPVYTLLALAPWLYVGCWLSRSLYGAVRRILD